MCYIAIDMRPMFIVKSIDDPLFSHYIWNIIYEYATMMRHRGTEIINHALHSSRTQFQ